MTDEDTVRDDEHDLRDRMLEATDTLVVDPALIRSHAVRGGRRRRRVRTGLAVTAVAASVVLVATVSGVAGDRVTGRNDNGADPADRTAEPTVYANNRTAIGNVTLTRGAAGTFTAKGGLAPRATGSSRVELWAGLRGEPLTQRAAYAARPGLGVFGYRFQLAPGVWNIQLRYVYDDAGSLDTGVYSAAIVLREDLPSDD